MEPESQRLSIQPDIHIWRCCASKRKNFSCERLNNRKRDGKWNSGTSTRRSQANTNTRVTPCARLIVFKCAHSKEHLQNTFIATHTKTREWCVRVCVCAVELFFFVLFGPSNGIVCATTSTNGRPSPPIPLLTFSIGARAVWYFDRRRIFNIPTVPSVHPY